MAIPCPRCSIDLSPSALGWISCCKRCGGVFASRVVGPLGVHAARTAEAASDSAVMRAATAARISCPICSRMMEREPFRGLEVDRCAEHGIWFDRDEVVHAMKGTRPRTLLGLGPEDSDEDGDDTATRAERAPNSSAATPLELADIGLRRASAKAQPARANADAEDAAAWLVVDIVAGLFNE